MTKPDAKFAHFVTLLLALSAPVWVAGSLWPVILMPGLTLAALAFVLPGAAALILTYRDRGRAGTAALLGRIFDVERIQRPWRFAVLIFTSPLTFVLCWALIVALGRSLPAAEPAFSRMITLFFIFLAPALCEELGWTAYLLDPLGRRWSMFRAGLVIGVVWALWHVFPLLETGRGPWWIASWGCWTISARLVMVWLYERMGRSVFGMALYHATSNTAWQSFPAQGSHFDPAMMAAVTALLAALLWITSTLPQQGRGRLTNRN